MLTIGINGAKGVGKTTLIDRLCVELGDDYLVGVLPDLSISPNAASDHHNYQNATLFSRSSVENRELSDHILFVEGNASNYEKWASAEVRELIHVIDLDQSNIRDSSNNGFVEHAGLLVANKLDLLDVMTPRFVEISLQAQIKRGLQPSVFCSMYTGFGLDQIVVYIKYRVVMSRILNRHRRR